MKALLLVAEHGGPTMFARIGMMRALNRHKLKRHRHLVGNGRRLTGSFDCE
jgi:hypothetical protein